MELALAPEVERMIEDCMKTGGFITAEDVVSAAVHRFREKDLSSDFAPGELNRLIEEGENSGPPIPYEQVRAELKALREARSTDNP
jgi:Arc/MetJ-type ribon-helix-helix transcriptional regulator